MFYDYTTVTIPDYGPCIAELGLLVLSRTRIRAQIKQAALAQHEPFPDFPVEPEVTIVSGQVKMLVWQFACSVSTVGASSHQSNSGGCEQCFE